MTLDQLLQQVSSAQDLPRREARMLLAFTTGKTQEWLVAHGTDEADTPSAARFAALCRRRALGEPIAYLTGAREFFSRRFAVTPAVLIPRPETELLVEIVLATIANVPAPRLLDLGTGSGIIAVTLALERPDATVFATDISEAALEVARANAAALGAGRIGFRAGNWWQALGAQDSDFDVIASNPPYIAASDPHLSQGDLRFEPPQALSAGPHGDDDLRLLAAGAPSRLRHQGWLVLEHGFEQAGRCRELMQQCGLGDIRTHTDLEHRERVTVGRRIQQR